MPNAFLYGVGGGKPLELEDKTVALDMLAGDQVVYPSTNYDALSKVTVTKPATLIHENIKKDENIGGVVGTFAGTPIVNDLDGLVDGSITSFIMPSGKTTVRANLFQSLTSLTSADLTGATTIGNYAFDGCSNAAITLPSTLTSVGQYAFRNVQGGFMILNCPNSPCSVGTYAFNGAKIQKVLGKFSSIGTYAFASCLYLSKVDIEQSTSIGDYAFNSCNAILEVDVGPCTSVGQYAFSGLSSMTKLHIVINGSIAQYAFRNANYVNDLSITGVITGTLGNYGFQQLGYLRSNPDQNVLVIDFSNSTFTAVGEGSFYGSSSNYGLRYMDITFPRTCTSFGTQCFSYMQNSDLWFTRTASVPTIQSNTFNGITNTNLWVPYNAVTAYRTATNWAAQSANIKGYAPANTFQQGDTLPTMTSDYYGITWYSDKAMTQQVTTVTDPTAPLYCTVGTTKLMYEIKTVTAMDCTVTISDGTNTYVQGDLVATGTSLTISTTATDASKPAVYMFRIDGTDYAPASSQQITVSGDISIVALYWDEENPPIDILDILDWATIKSICESGNIPVYWLDPTNLKTDSNGNHWRCVDTKAGRYTKVGGGTTNAVFMKVEPYQNSIRWSQNNYNVGYDYSDLRSSLQSGGSLFNKEDTTLSGLVNDSNIQIICRHYFPGGNNSITITAGFFLASYTEMGFTDSYGTAGSFETVNNGTTFGAYEYFSDNENAKRAGNTQRWLRSNYNYQLATFLESSGEISSSIYNSNKYAVPCFAW